MLALPDRDPQTKMNPNTVADFIDPDWGIKSTPAWGCTGMPTM
jgi:hypothetical protein